MTTDPNSYHSTERTRKGAICSFGSRTDVGSVREQNEDSLIVAPPLYVVADGMGGHAAGEIASEITVRTLAEHAPEHADVEALGEAVMLANRTVLDASLNGQGRKGMGTTCTAAMLEGNHLVIAQVGDSRAYLLHNGSLSQITRDHSLMADLIDSGQITPEEARYHPNRSVITRALGNDPNMVPDLYEITVEDGDRLLLCSDGLTSMVIDKNIESIMASQADPQKCATKLVDEAIAAGGHDNVTVIVVDVEGSSKVKRTRLARRTKITLGAVLCILIAAFCLAGYGVYSFVHNSAYLAESSDGFVEIYEGIPGEVLGLSHSELVETTDIRVSSLTPGAAERIREGLQVGSMEEARDLVDSYREQAKPTAQGSNASENAASNSAASASDSTGATASTSASTGDKERSER